MPTVKLKPNSPEYADAKKKVDNQLCDMPGCSHPAMHKAPKHRGLDEYYHLCIEHVREYNQAWDFFSGMSSVEVEDHILKSVYGFRPTWEYGVNGQNPEDILFREAQKMRGSSEEEPKQKRKTHFTDEQRNTPEFEAMSLMGLEPPVTLDDIKARYKELAKKYHPDLNQACEKSENLLKRINMAYTLLKMAYTNYEDIKD